MQLKKRRSLRGEPILKTPVFNNRASGCVRHCYI